MWNFDFRIIEQIVGFMKLLPIWLLKISCWLN